MLLQSVDDPERFGVANIQNRKIIEIEEKPKERKVLMQSQGFICMIQSLFLYKRIKTFRKGELEITDINNWYLKRGYLLIMK